MEEIGTLSEKQKKFANEYLKDLNATQAAIRAGYSVNTAAQQASRLLTNVKVQRYINERQRERLKRVEINQDRVLSELASIAFSKASDYASVVERPAMTEINGVMFPVKDNRGKTVMCRTVESILTEELSEEQKRALCVIKKGRDGIEVRTYDKIRALELLGKHLGMFEDKIEVTGQVNNPFADLTTEELKKLINDE